MGRLKTLIPVLAIALTAVMSQAHADHEDAYEMREQGRILPLETILARQRQDLDGRVLEVELEHDDGRMIYELEVLDAHGSVWELSYDAASGEPIRQRQED